MIINKKIAALIAAAGLIALTGACQSGGGSGSGGSSGGYNPHNAVYHFNSSNCKRIAGGLRNVGNHYKAFGNDATKLQVAAVFHGNGVFPLFKKQGKHSNPKKGKTWKVGCNEKLRGQIASRLATLKGLGMEIKICNNTLRGRAIKIGQLMEVESENIVPSGVAEIGKLQIYDKYRYIKP